MQYNHKKNIIKQMYTSKKQQNMITTLLFCIMLFIPILSASLSSADEPNIIWDASLQIQDASGIIDHLTFGEAMDANNGPPADSYDVAKPPSPMPPYLNAWFSDNLPTPYTTLWKDYRLYPDTYKKWNLSIRWVPDTEEPQTNISISWNPNEFLSSEYTTITLFSQTGTPLQNMRTSTNYNFMCPAYIPQTFTIICETENTPPQIPTIPVGETNGYHGTTYSYTSTTIDLDNDSIFYRFNWGDNTTSDWLGPYPSGESCIINHSWMIPNTYLLRVQAQDANGSLSSWSQPLTIIMGNRAPTPPSNPFPVNNSTTIDITPTLQWNSIDPDNGDILTFDVYFGTTNPPPQLVTQQSTSSFTTQALSYSTTYYWEIICWDNYGASTSGELWTFTTKPSSNGGTSPPPPSQENQVPTADASVSETIGYINMPLHFNGSYSSDPDGYITSWLWDYGDGSYASAEITTHSYQQPGEYQVRLTVTDNDGATDDDTIAVRIISANNPPTKPEISGSRYCNINQSYSYVFSSTDGDEDAIQYTCSWGDTTEDVSEYLTNGTTYVVAHTWSQAGMYRITVTANDNTTWSVSSEFIVYVGVTFITIYGFLLDTDGDTFYDLFYDNDTGIQTQVTRVDTGVYHFQIGNNSKIIYEYDPLTGSFTALSQAGDAQDNWIFFGIFMLAILIIAIIIYFYKKGFF